MTIGKNEKLIPINAVPALLVELTGVSRGIDTIYKWIKRGKGKGCRTLDGRMVKLETTKRLRQIFTTKKAVIKFIEDVG